MVACICPGWNQGANLPLDQGFQIHLPWLQSEENKLGQLQSSREPSIPIGMKASTCAAHVFQCNFSVLTAIRRASEESILAIQIFDQKKFKKKDQGFLGVINVRIGSVIDLEIGGDGERAREYCFSRLMH